MTIYAKMPYHFKKILNRAYLEDKPLNVLVLQLERELSLNCLGAPEEVTLVPLNKIGAIKPRAGKKTDRK